MKKCDNCGVKLDSNINYCPNCGSSNFTEIYSDQSNQNFNQGYSQTFNHNINFDHKIVDSGSFGWTVLGFFIPIVGLILYLVWMNEKPNTAKRCLTGFIASIVLYVCLIICYIAIFVFALIGSSGFLIR